MSPNNLEIKAGITVLKPASKVFQAIVDPGQMCNYFISKSSGPMEEGATVNWQFPEFDMQFPVIVGRIEENEFISFSWNDDDGTETFVEIRLTPKGEQATKVRIKETGRQNDEAGIAWLGRNTEGWANFLACMKAWLEYGVHLRKGAFEMEQMPELK